MEPKLTCLPSQHLASYPPVRRLSHLLITSVPLAPLIVQASRSVAASTGKKIPGLFRARPLSPFSLSKASRPGAGHERNNPNLHRFLLLLDATAAQALRSIDYIVLLFVEAGRTVSRCVVWSTSQLRELGGYLNKAYHEEASKWAGASDIIVFCGAVSFTIAVSAFDALVVVAEWLFDSREVRRLEKTERMV